MALYMKQLLQSLILIAIIIHFTECTWVYKEVYDPETGHTADVRYWGSTQTPTHLPTESPTRNPTTKNPTVNPTKTPTKQPTQTPTRNPTLKPSQNPTRNPTKSPTVNPTKSPTDPTKHPTVSPTKPPTPQPTKQPTPKPTLTPTHQPTEQWDSVGARTKHKPNKKKAASSKAKQKAKQDVLDYQLLHAKKKGSDHNLTKTTRQQLQSIQQDSIKLYFYDENVKENILKQHIGQLVQKNNHALYVLPNLDLQFNHSLSVIKYYTSIESFMKLQQLYVNILTQMNGADFRLLRDNKIQQGIIKHLFGFKDFMIKRGFQFENVAGNDSDFLHILCEYVPIGMRDVLDDKMRNIERIYKNTTYGIDGKIQNMRGYKKEMNQYKLKIMNITHQALK
eukprot:345374_1